MDRPPIRIAIAGYGNLGRGVQIAVGNNPDMTLVGVYTRRDPQQLADDCAPVAAYRIDELASHQDRIDVLVLCGGSKQDLPQQGPQLARLFNTVDSFDTHPRIPDYFAAVDQAAQAGGRTALIAVGWDPGMFSINRLYGQCLLPDGDTYTFWGRGLSQGHSDAIRRVPGVKAGVQYTIPSAEAIEQVRSGSRPVLTTRQKHTRQCFVVLDDGADPETVRHSIVTMPDYFADYQTTVQFISEPQLQAEHSRMPHGGFVIRSGSTSPGNHQVTQYSLQLDSNPEFTASVLVAFARATYRLHRQGQIGAKTVLDVPPGLLSPLSAAQLRRDLL